MTKAKTKKKIKDIEEILEAHDENFTEITSIVKEMIKKYCPYSGAVTLAVDEGESIKKYFMVTDFHVSEPFIIFHHLISDDERDLTLESFPAKNPKKSIYDHMRAVYKTKRWTIVKEQLLIGSFVSISSVGGFDYLEPIKQGDYPYKFKENEGAVKELTKQA